jgi:hypothetical protein
VAVCGQGEHYTLAELFAQADKAMYAEKAAKRRPPAND